MVMKNPFVTNGYAGPEYFCDRVEETQHITEMLTNENNMALVSPRRIGKTELIHHCFAQPAIQKDYYTFIIDIYSTNSVSGSICSAKPLLMNFALKAEALGRNS